MHSTASPIPPVRRFASVPFTVEYAPAPLNFNVRPRFDWKMLLGIPWECYIIYELWHDFHQRPNDLNFDLVLFAIVTAFTILAFIRRESIQIYPDRMVWRKTYFGFPHERSAPLADVLGAQWTEGHQDRQGKRPDFVEFFLPSKSVKACYGFTFDEFDSMREHIRTMYPDLIKRWGSSSVRSKDFTLLNLH
jgi:hypothetical protein